MNNIKLLAIISGASFWCLGLLVVFSVHTQQPLNTTLKSPARPSLTHDQRLHQAAQPIQIKACFHCYVDLQE